MVGEIAKTDNFTHLDMTSIGTDLELARGRYWIFSRALSEIDISPAVTNQKHAA